MNKNVLIVLAGGFVIAILVAVLVQASLGGSRGPSSEETQVEILVAAKELPMGATLSPNDLKWQAWPGTPFAGAVIRKEQKSPSDALSGRLIQKVSQGQPVLESYVFKEGKGNLVAAALEKGMRAVAIPVKADTMAGGFISPGDRVDVILTHQIRMAMNESTQSLVSRYASETILKNIRVLAVDQEASREDDKAKIARTVTLAVSIKGAEQLALAAEMGDITLALRGIGDSEEAESPQLTTDVHVSRVMQDVATRQGNGAGSGSVRIYSGDTVQEVKPRSSLSGGYVRVLGKTSPGAVPSLDENTNSVDHSPAQEENTEGVEEEGISE